MPEAAPTLGDFILDSAGRYLQTVVVVDDRIYENASGSVATRLRTPSPGPRKAALRSAAAAPPQKAAAEQGEEGAEAVEEVSFHDVQNSFAKKRIICSLYQPKKNASFGELSDVYCLCSAADVVIVDWDLHGDSGSKATTLVANLIEQSMKDIPNQLRLVLIYTMETNLHAVADQLYEELGRRVGKEKIGVDSATKGLILTTVNARVVILGKRENTSLQEYADFWVPEKMLAERTIKEFSLLASGLLQAVVLRGVAKLRDNNRRILMRFQPGLDAAFLTHRALSLPKESFSQIVPLLTDEMRAVLEDTLGENPIGSDSEVEAIIGDWCTTQWKPGSNATEYVGAGGDSLGLARSAFCKGEADQSNYKFFQKGGSCKNLPWKNKPLKVAEFLSGAGGGESPHQELGSLMSQRVRYGDAQRPLHLGVIVREMGRKRRYFLCLQPVCDSVRINGIARTFIFCSLSVPEDGGGFTHVVVDLKNKAIRLRYNPQVEHCLLIKFTTGTDSLLASKDGKGRFFFRDEAKDKYEWIAELKTEHAQRAAEEFGRNLSRVGLTESEWLRLKARQS